MKTPEQVQAQILDAANVRFQKYGFNKTTMAEIAKDCAMSPANLYRYFASKGDIGAGICGRVFDYKAQMWRDMLSKPKLSAAQRLEHFAVENLHFAYHNLANQPAIFELVEFISNERQDLMAGHKELERAMLAEILAQGNHNREFEVQDIVATAALIQAAISFYFPRIILNVCNESLEQFELLLKGVVGLIVQGLARRSKR